ncbi:MAG: plasmid stabilization protein [Alphaproteobacteria bacterium]|nr:MAG: plasmid stabilization protein [Alphaproteobacteria bacterium]
MVTEGAALGMERCRRFLEPKNPLAARRAAEAIANKLDLLAQHPDIGRPFEDVTQLRELLIEFGDSGYVALYRYEPPQDTIYLLAFRHQKEAGY